MTTIIYIPLDERPVNRIFPQILAEATPGIVLRTPPAELLGTKKRPANLGALWEWLEKELPGADKLLCSLDMLFYGGIAPSRIHQLSREEAASQLERLEQLKVRSPNIEVFAFSLIMRVPANNSSDEEPDYYRHYGQLIFRWGWLRDQLSRGQGGSKEREELTEVMAAIPAEVQCDYLQRRELNHFVNSEAIKLVERDIIDFLVIPLDDCAEYGFSAAEQRKLLRQVEQTGLQQRIHVYPGADEVGSTLLCRICTLTKGTKPRIFVRYSSVMGSHIIPRYEDRPLGESIKSQITVCGGIMVDNSLEADVILMVNSPTLNHGAMQEASRAVLDKDTSYYSFRNLREFVESIAYYLSMGQRVALADVAFGNGADHELMQMLARGDHLSALYSYAAWNTPGNTIGTVLAHSLLRFQNQDTVGQLCKFVLDRYLEDWGYQALVRSSLTPYAEELGASYFDLKDKQPLIQEAALDMLRKFALTHLGAFKDLYTVESLHFPWNRLFEIGFTSRLKS